MSRRKKLKDIATELGVSPSAVSIVMNNRKGVSAETRQRIARALEACGYPILENEAQPDEAVKRPLQTIRLLKYKNSAILVEENGNFVSSIIDSLEEECRFLGYRLVITSYGPEDKKSVYESLCADPSCGIIVLGTELEASDLPFLEQLPVPMVLVDTPAPGHSLNCVTMNNEEIAGKAVRYLYDLGHRDIGYLHSSMNTGNFTSRWSGYHIAMEQLGLSIRQEQIYALTPSLTGSYQEMCGFLKNGRRPPTALLADNDMIALGCSRALKDNGFLLPADCSIIGIDDIPFSSICAPQLTSVHIPCKELGAQAVRLLHYKLENPRTAAAKIFIDGHLIIRGSAVPGSIVS